MKQGTGSQEGWVRRMWEDSRMEWLGCKEQRRERGRGITERWRGTRPWHEKTNLTHLPRISCAVCHYQHIYSLCLVIEGDEASQVSRGSKEAERRRCLSHKRCSRKRAIHPIAIYTMEQERRGAGKVRLTVIFLSGRKSDHIFFCPYLPQCLYCQGCKLLPSSI